MKPITFDAMLGEVLGEAPKHTAVAAGVASAKTPTFRKPEATKEQKTWIKSVRSYADSLYKNAPANIKEKIDSISRGAKESASKGLKNNYIWYSKVIVRANKQLLSSQEKEYENRILTVAKARMVSEIFKVTGYYNAKKFYDTAYDEATRLLSRVVKAEEKKKETKPVKEEKEVVAKKEKVSEEDIILAGKKYSRDDIMDMLIKIDNRLRKEELQRLATHEHAVLTKTEQFKGTVLERLKAILERLDPESAEYVFLRNILIRIYGVRI